MKQNLILWTAAIIIVFVAAYYKTITSQYYPVSGSFSLQGEKVTFKFDKISRGGENFPVLIRSDMEDLSGYIKWSEEDSNDWQYTDLKPGEGILKGEITGQPAFTVINYRVVLIHNNDSLTIPRTEPVILEFRNKVSPAIEYMFYFFLFAGILMAVRSGLEYFRENSKVKAFSVFTLIFFTLLAFIFSPLKNSYESGFMKDYIPAPGEIFILKDIAYFLIWLSGFILLFLFKKQRASILITSVIVLLYFLIAVY